MSRLPSFVTSTNVSRECTSHTAAWSKDARCVVGVRRLGQVGQGILHVIHLHRVRCTTWSARLISDLLRNVPLPTISEDILCCFTADESKTSWLCKTQQVPLIATMGGIATRSMEPPKDRHRLRCRRWCYQGHAPLVGPITESHNLPASSAIDRASWGVRWVWRSDNANACNQNARHSRLDKAAHRNRNESLTRLHANPIITMKWRSTTNTSSMCIHCSHVHLET